MAAARDVLWGEASSLRSLEQWVEDSVRIQALRLAPLGTDALQPSTTLTKVCALGMGPLRTDCGADVAAAADRVLSEALVTEAGGNGSCLFHAFLAAAVPEVRSIMDPDARIALGVAFRKRLALQSAARAFEVLHASDPGAWSNPLEPGATFASPAEYEAALFDDSAYACHGMLLHLSWAFKVNIFAVQAIEEGGSWGVTCTFDAVSPSPFSRDWMSIALLEDAYGAGHFRALCFVSPELQHRVYLFSPRSTIVQQCLLPLANCVRVSVGFDVLAGGGAASSRKRGPRSKPPQLRTSRSRSRGRGHGRGHGRGGSGIAHASAHVSARGVSPTDRHSRRVRARR